MEDTQKTLADKIPHVDGEPHAQTSLNASSINPFHAEIQKMENRLESEIRKYSAAEITIFAFLTAIFLGSFILYATENLADNFLSYVDALFIASSAICVTGLASIDFSKFTFAGQLVTMILIQIGGFGVITAFRLLWIGRGDDLNPGSAQTLGNILDVEGRHQTVLQVLASTARITFGIELIGCAILYAHVMDKIDSPFWFSIFHTVSAFNNAGFGLFADNLVQYRSDMVINLVIATG